MRRCELARLLRFSVTGVTVATVYVAGYTVLVRLGLPNFAANLIAFIMAVLFQYVAQTLWTFRKPLRDREQVIRFALTIGFGLLFSTAISTQVGPNLGWAPWVAASVVAVTLAVINYIVFRFWVYRVGADTKET